MAKKIFSKIIMVVAMLVIMTVPAFAAEAETATPAAPAVITAEWNAEKQTIEVQGIDYANHNYKVQLVDATGKVYTCQADANTHLPVNENGTYEVRVLKHKVDNKYSRVFSKQVVVENCKGYMGSSEVVDFEENQKFLQSDTIQKIISSKENSKVAKAAFQYLDKNWKYNYERAKTVKSWYVPNTDANDADKSGICYDYAAAYASMMREAGIQCKVIFGYVQTKTGSVYHAWNEVNLNGKWYIVDACWGEYGSTNYVRSTSYIY